MDNNTYDSICAVGPKLPGLRKPPHPFRVATRSTALKKFLTVRNRSDSFPAGSQLSATRSQPEQDASKRIFGKQKHPWNAFQGTTVAPLSQDFNILGQRSRKHTMRSTVPEVAVRGPVCSDTRQWTEPVMQMGHLQHHQVYTTNCQTLEDQVASQAQRTDSVTAKEDARQCSQAQVSDLKRSLQASGQKHLKRVTQLMQKLFKQREKHRNLMLKQTHVHNLAMMSASIEIAGIKLQLSCQHDELESAQKQLAYLEDSTARMTTEHCHVTQAQDEESKALRQQVHKTECEMERLQKKLQLEQQIAKTAHNRNIAHYREHASEELTKLSLMRELSIREESLSAATLEADAAKTQIWLLEMMVDDATVEKARAVKAQDTELKALRQQVRESACTNERINKELKLERQIAKTAQNHNRALCHDLTAEELTRLSLVQKLSNGEESLMTAHDHDKALCNDLRSEELARLSLVRELGIREDTLLAATSKADATTTRINLLEKMLDDAAIEKRIAVQAKEAKLATLRNLMALSVSQAEGLQSKLKESSADNRALQREVKHKDAMVQHLHTQIASLSSKLDISAKAQKRVAGDLLKQLQYGTNQAAKMSTRLIQADASKVVLEQRLAQREKEIKALHSQMSDLNVKAEETAKVDSALQSSNERMMHQDLDSVTSKLFGQDVKIAALGKANTELQTTAKSSYLETGALQRQCEIQKEWAMWQMESQQLQLKAPKLQLNHQRATGPPADPSCEALWGAMSRFAVPSSRRVLAAAHSKDLLQSSDPTGCQLNKAGQAPSSFSIAAKPFVPVWLACKQPQSSVPPSYDYSGVLQAGETFGESATVGTASPALTSQSARRVTANAAPPALNCHAAVTDLHQAASDSMQLWPSFSKTWAEDDTAEDEEAGPGGPSSSHPDLWDSASSAQGDHEALNDGALEDGALHETALDEGALHDVPNKHDQQKPSTANHAEATAASLEGAAASLVQEQTPSAAPGAAEDQDDVHSAQAEGDAPVRKAKRTRRGQSSQKRRLDAFLQLKQQQAAQHL